MKIIIKAVLICTISLLTIVSAIAETSFGKTADLTEITLKSLEGRVVMVTFWATWCSPCRKELPVLNAMLNQSGEENLAVVAVNWKEDRKQYRKFLRKNKKKSKILYIHDRFGKIAKPFDVKAIPFLLIYDHTGELRYKHTGYNEKNLGRIVKEVNGLLIEKYESKSSL